MCGWEKDSGFPALVSFALVIFAPVTVSVVADTGEVVSRHESASTAWIMDLRFWFGQAKGITRGQRVRVEEAIGSVLGCIILDMTCVVW